MLNQEESEIEWEDEEDEDDQIDNEDKKKEGIIINLNNLNNNNNKQKKKKGKGKLFVKDTERQLAYNRHKEDLINMLDKSNAISQSCNDEFLMSILQSMLPKDLIEYGKKFQLRKDFVPKKANEFIISIIKWFRNEFEIIKHEDITEDEGRDGSNVEDLFNFVISNKRGSIHQLTQLVICLLRSFEFQVRYIRTLEPRSINPLNHIDLNENIRRRRDKLPEISNPTIDSVSSIFDGKNMSSNFALQLTHLMSQNYNSVDEEYIYKKKCDYKHNRIYCWVEVYLATTQEVVKTKPLSLKRKLDKISTDKEDNNISIDSASDFDFSDQKDMVLLDDANGDAVNNEVSIFDMLDDEDDNEIKLKTNSKNSSNTNNKIIENLTSGNNGGIIDESNSYVNRWVCIDSFSQPKYNFDEPKIIESKLRRVVPYFLAIGNEGFKDVTSRYCCKFIKNTELRLPDYYWWENILLQKNANLNNSSSSSTFSSILTSKKSKRLIKLQDNDENNEFIKLNEDNSIPITISDFKSSSKYTLLRHIRNDQCVHPNAKIAGIFKGEKYYLKQDIHVLLPKSKWKIKMLSVKEDEIEIKKLKGKNKEGEDMEWSVYGEWQTESYRPPQVENGLIPTNEHGKVELWDSNESLLPSGCCLIRSNTALAIAAKLGFEAHHAIVGFERKGQHTRPVLGGTVVLKEHKLIIESALSNVEDYNVEKYFDQKEKKNINTWKKIVLSLLSRQKLKDSYGH